MSRAVLRFGGKTRKLVVTEKKQWRLMFGV
jgi:hypothetical protein